MLTELFNKALLSEGRINEDVQKAILEYALSVNNTSLIELLLAREELVDAVDDRIGEVPSARVVACWLRAKKRTPEQIRDRLEVERKKRRITVFEVIAGIEKLDKVAYEYAASINSAKVALALLDNDDAAAVHRKAVLTLVKTYNPQSLSGSVSRNITRALANRPEHADVVAKNTDNEVLLLLAAKSGTLKEDVATGVLSKILERMQYHVAAVVASGKSSRYSSYTNRSGMIECAQGVAHIVPTLTNVQETYRAITSLNEAVKALEGVGNDRSDAAAMQQIAISVSAVVSPDTPLSRVRAAKTSDELEEALKPFEAEFKKERSYWDESTERDLVAASVLSNRAANIRQLRMALNSLVSHQRSTDLVQHAMHWVDDAEALTEFLAAGLVHDDDVVEALAKHYEPADLWRRGVTALLDQGDDRRLQAYILSSLFDSRYADPSMIPMLPISCFSWHYVGSSVSEMALTKITAAFGGNSDLWNVFDKITTRCQDASLAQAIEAATLAGEEVISDKTCEAILTASLGSQNIENPVNLVKSVAKFRKNVTDEDARQAVLSVINSSAVGSAKQVQQVLSHAAKAFKDLGNQKEFWTALGTLGPRHKGEIDTLFGTCRRVASGQRPVA